MALLTWPNAAKFLGARAPTQTQTQQSLSRRNDSDSVAARSANGARRAAPRAPEAEQALAPGRRTGNGQEVAHVLCPKCGKPCLRLAENPHHCPGCGQDFWL